jgi:hypothetical protein
MTQTDLRAAPSAGETMFLQAEVALLEQQLHDAQVSYARGRKPLAEVTACETQLQEAQADLKAHLSALQADQAAQAEEERRRTLRALFERLEVLRVVLTDIETEDVRDLEAHERQLHEARIRSGIRRGTARSLRDEGRNAVARFAALCGDPSPAVAPLTMQEAHNHDTLLGRWRLSSSDTPDRMDVFPLQTPADPDEARDQHRRRWSASLAAVSLWKPSEPE